MCLLSFRFDIASKESYSTACRRNVKSSTLSVLESHPPMRRWRPILLVEM